jgi:hypothetical protein
MAQGVQHEPTDENRSLVKSLSAMGTRYVDIALKLEINTDTLTKYYSRELELGRVDANAKVAQGLFNQAVNGNTSAGIFWMKTRAGWKETNALELSGANGGAITIISKINVKD